MLDSDLTLLNRRRHVMGDSPLFYEEPIHLVRGEGVYLYAADGRRYLDCYNNIPIVGHCNARVVDALYRQSRILNVHSRYLSSNIVDYAERLVSTFGGKVQQVMFTCTGSEANDQALRIARMFGRGRGIICSNSGYHGNTAAVDQVSPLFQKEPHSYPEVRAVPFPDTYRGIDGASGQMLADAYLSTIKAAVDSLNAAGTGVAGMILCSIFANEGLPRVPPGLLEKATAIVREAGGLIIADEVQAGFGRTGKMWGHDVTGFTPDIVTIGKPMGNGYPIAALVGRSDLLDAYRKRTFYFNTFAAAQMAAAVAKTVLDIIEDQDLLANAREVGNVIRRGLIDLAGRHALIGEVRGDGLWVGVELVRNRETKEPATQECGRLVNELKRRGVLLSRMGAYENVLKIRPPLVFDRTHAEELLRAVDISMTACRQRARDSEDPTFANIGALAGVDARFQQKVAL